MKHSIGIDCDGVCSDFAGRYRELSLRMFGVPTPANKPQLTWEFDWVTKEQDSAIWKRIDATENFWETLDTESGTDLLRDAQQYFNLYFITTRNKTSGASVEQQSMNWLKSKFDIQYPQVIVTKRKGDIAEALELYAFIDDKPSNCIDVWNVCDEQSKVFIRDQPYNQDASKLLIRVPTLDAMLEVLS